MRSRRLVQLFLALVMSLTVVSVATPAVAAFDRLRFGDTGWKVRVLQSRLHQLGLHSEVITSRFDAQTRDGVRTFQARRKRDTTGIVDRVTWDKLVAKTSEPTHEALHNIYTPGPAILVAGDRGLPVRRLQARLEQVQWWKGDVTGVFDQRTVEAVTGFQTKRRIPVTGEVDRRTLDRLAEMTRKPTKAELFNIEPKGAALDPLCMTGRAMCVDKTSRSLRWVIDGIVQSRYDVRFGSDELPTREGAFSVFKKSRDHVSSLYDTSMPFAMFFSGGRAVHYSPDFAATGYNGASHGCVNVRDYNGIRWLFDPVRIGDKVVVYRSSGGAQSRRSRG
ncbi:L,D-transpeptidase family protein [Nocardioides sp. B-3]|uniref:L,D-transpeptidase family protein n=1 Tax=Nocardioides sp. B-3 TaxID=2895565 RepID=UPI0021531A3B|nr:L,D-transpeptidase family protein [Nocardioides sp. B-3]UUZ60743.1 L,D-transpeptidase family protein [Nocardioides sp. B-3]